MDEWKKCCELRLHGNVIENKNGQEAREVLIIKIIEEKTAADNKAKAQSQIEH